MIGTVLTNKGLALITKLVAAQATLSFTRVAVGTGSVPSGVDPQSMIGLNAYKMDATIKAYGVNPDQADVAYIIAQISSVGVSAGFAITEAGIFAQDPDQGEILYAYLDLTDDPQYIYAETDAISKFAEITFNVLVGSVSSVTAIINPSALATKKDLESIEDRLNQLGRILFGPEDTEIEDNDVLYILDDNAEEKPFEAAAYNNVIFSATPPSGGQYWAQIEEDGKTVNILNGKLVVSDEEPTPPTDATFFGKSN